jgi:hypothetical protein
VLRTGLVAVVAILGFACAGSAAAASPALPSEDPFYAYSSSIERQAPGTVLRSRQVEISLLGAPAALQATQVLYRTRNQLGDATATVATIIRPATPAGSTKLVSYQTAYDGVGEVCRPSYNLAGGSGAPIVRFEGGNILNYLNRGYTVVTADYEGPTDDFGAGREAGYGTLDAIRAAQKQLELDPGTTPVAMVGYSGGALASEWAGELQPKYAPELDVVGIALGGNSVHFDHTLAYIDGTSEWAAVIPAVTVGVARAYGLDLTRYLSPRGKRIANQQGCLSPGAYPGLRFEDLLAPKYRDWKRERAIVETYNASIMGRAGTPKAPLFMAGGNSDGTGDGIAIAKDVQQLAYGYCRRGTPVQLREYAGRPHILTALVFAPEALAFIERRFAGEEAPNDCSSIERGNALDPLPTPSARAPRRAAGVKLSGLRRESGGYTVVVSATVPRATKARLSVYRLARSGRRALVRKTKLSGELDLVRRRVQVPVGSPAAGRRYELVLAGRLGTARVRTALAFRAA